MNNTENTEILKKHFHNVFNRNTKIDPTVIDQIDQRSNASTLDNLPSLAEVTLALKKVKNNKAPRLSGVTIDMLKTSQRKDMHYSPLLSNNFGKIMTAILTNGTSPNSQCSTKEKEAHTKGIHRKHNECNTCKKTPKKSRNNESQHQSIWPHQMPGSLHTRHSALILKRQQPWNVCPLC